jgi:ABC-2 type transport system ATP-binding protein
MALQISELSQVYKNGKRALDNLSLELDTGIIGLLGPNGAGKSTLMNILSTLVTPTSGSVTWRGTDILKNPNVLRRELGYLPQYFGVYDNLSAHEFLTYIAGLKEIPSLRAREKIDTLLESLNLAQVAHQPLKSYSGGMKQRIGIAQALLNDPRLLIVDEPTVGLDPEERRRFRELLADMAHERLIILSTHIVSDVESIADSIAIMAEGRLLHHDSPEAYLASVAPYVWQCLVSKVQLDELRNTRVISHTVRHAEGFEIKLISHRQPMVDARLVAPTLEDAFLYFSRVRETSATAMREVA